MSSGSPGLLDCSVAPAAADAAASMLDKALEDRKRIHKYLARLREVRRSLKRSRRVIHAAASPCALLSRAL